jgi:hypothetical protein
MGVRASDARCSERRSDARAPDRKPGGAGSRHDCTARGDGGGRRGEADVQMRVDISTILALALTLPHSPSYAADEAGADR